MGLFDFLFGKKTGGANAQNPAAESPSRIPPASSGLDAVAAKFPFPVRGLRRSVAERTLLKLRVELNAQGKTPVLIGDKENALRLLDTRDDEAFDVAAGLKLSYETTPQAWFAARVAEDPECYGGLDELGEMPEKASPNTDLQCASDAGVRIREVYIAEIPTTEAWQVPLYLRYGGWNECPSPSEHALMARYWYEKYGAVIATVSGDIMEYTVERPPETDSDALDLARQQYVYCHDIVDQGTDSIAALAASLRKSTRWFFWWD